MLHAWATVLPQRQAAGVQTRSEINYKLFEKLGLVATSTSSPAVLIIAGDEVIQELLVSRLGGAFGPEINHDFSDGSVKVPQLARLGNRLRACPRNSLKLGRQG